MTSFDDLFAHLPIIAILRDLPLTDAMRMAETAWDLGIDAIEVTIATQDQIPTLTALVQAGKLRGKLVGAGTVFSLEQVRAAQRAGAAFTVAPGLDVTVLAVSTTAGMPHLPGVATPTEIQHAHNAGCRWVKAFPASTLGPQWFTQIAQPFPHIKLVATGGVNASNAIDYLNSGACAVGIGSAHTRPGETERLIKTVHAQRAPA